MRIAKVVVICSLAGLLFCPACGQEQGQPQPAGLSDCAQALEHVATCLSQPTLLENASGGCDPVAAREANAVLELSCDRIREAQATSVVDPASGCGRFDFLVDENCAPPVAANVGPPEQTREFDLAVRIAVVDVPLDPPGCDSSPCSFAVQLKTPLWSAGRCIGPLQPQNSLDLWSTWKVPGRFVVRAVDHVVLSEPASDVLGLLEIRIGMPGKSEACVPIDDEPDESGFRTQLLLTDDLPSVEQLVELDPEDLQLLAELAPANNPTLIRGPMRLLELECSLATGACLRKEACRASTCAGRGDCQVATRTTASGYREDRVTCLCQAGFEGDYCEHTL